MAARRGDAGRIQPQLGQRRTLGQPDLGLHQVDAGDLFGHGVLDLQPRIGLDEDEGLGAVLARDVDQEFESAQALVAHAAGKAQRGGNDLLAQRVVQTGRRGDLDDLLEAPLQAAFALAQVHHRPLAVAQDLHLDMAGPCDELLDKDIGAAERRQRFGLAAREGRLDLFDRLHRARAAPAAAGDRFDDHRRAGA